MKKLQKILAIVLSVVMVMAMAVPGFAADATDSAKITVSGLKPGDDVYAVQIIKPTYDDNGNFLKYVWADTFGGKAIGDEVEVDDTDGMIKDLTSEAMQTYAANKDFGSPLAQAVKQADGSGVATLDLPVGSYMIIAKSATDNAVVYNPMVGSVYYEGTVVEGAGPDASTSWALKGTDVYVKSSEPELVKTIDPCGATDSAKHGDDVAIGDDVSFKVETSIPSYSDEYTKVVYKITDKMDPSLDLDVTSIKVYVGGNKVDAAADTFTITPDTADADGKVHGYVVDFVSKYALDNAGEAVQVTYSAKLNKNATSNLDANENRVQLDYSHDPKNENDTKTKNDITYHYTFEIDGAILGNKVEKEKVTWGEKEITHEFIKVGPDDIQEMVTEGDEQQYSSYKEIGGTDPQGLEGAIFTLYEADGTTPVVQNVTTDKYGYLNIKGLDAGDYVLKETKAPNGYSLNQTAVKVNITASYYDDTDKEKQGLLKEYSITMDDGNGAKVTNTYTAEYGTIDKGLTKDEILPTKITHNYKPADPDGTFWFKNTKLGALPATGGVGTTIFTITGVILMVMAAAMMLFVRRRREQ